MPIDNIDTLREYAKPLTVTCKRTALTKNERKVLKVLVYYGADECMVPITQKRIALESGLQQSKVCYALERLKAKDYVIAISIGRADALGVIKEFKAKKGSEP
jgi:DNA-binding MarR family transcriptional regulator